MIINNVKLVLEDDVVQGSLEIEGGVIRAFAETQSRLPAALDGEGGFRRRRRLAAAGVNRAAYR